MSDQSEPQYVTKDELQSMLEEAALKGSERALKRIGLSDDNALDDVKEIRKLLDAWRLTKNTVWTAGIRFITTAILGGIIAAVYYQWGK